MLPALVLGAGGAGPWQYFDSESQTLKASLDDSPRPIFVPTTECVVHRVKNKAAHQAPARAPYTALPR